ncbi:5120_t:CDS:2, partial [Paraglomus occultum]
KVAYWNELDSQLITSVGFSLDGRISVAGSFTGLCLFYETEGLKYNTQIHVKSSRGRNSKGKKITGIEAMPGTLPGQDKILISSNDSRIRLYNMRDKSLECKYKGLENTCSQIRATFSDDGRYIICGSEDRNVCIWNTDQSGMHTSKSSGGGFLLKKDKASYEYFEAHSSIVTVAIFAPTRTKRLIAQCGDPIFVRTHQDNTEEDSSGLPTYPDGNIIVCADYNGSIKVFRNDCAYYPNQDTDNISIRSNRSWMNNLVAFGTRRQSDASSVFSAGSRSTRGGSVNDEKAAGQQVKCLCGSTDFKAFLGGSPTLVCVGCGKSSDVRV